MAICPFAKFEEITGPVGDYLGGPFKIVHHTTEGTSYAGAKAAYKANRSDPHFTVDGDEIFQHIDTGKAARSLRNSEGGVQTNRDSAVQIEVVAFAGKPKDIATLRSVAKLCRWIEETHAIAQTWPNGPPRASTNGHDPGGHNRNAATWDATGGHFGHSQVPENTHWDPAYTVAELAIVTPEAVFDSHAALESDAAPTRAMASESSSAGIERADDILQRVLAGLAAASPATIGPASRITIRVSTGGVDVQVTIEPPAAAGQAVGQAAAEESTPPAAPEKAGRSRKKKTKSKARRR
jgi:hypothetical protein